MKQYCHVAVDCPLPQEHFTYQINSTIGLLPVGTLVNIPFGKRITRGIIVKNLLAQEDLTPDISVEKIKEIDSISDTSIKLSAKEINFYTWMSAYYHYPMGQLIFDCLPKKMKRPRALSYLQGKNCSFDFNLGDNHKEIIQGIMKNIVNGFQKHLIHGVTGSGKTFIYLSLMKEILQTKSVLFLLPEINLTPQFLSIFGKYLNAKIYSYSSSISNSDRYGLWQMLQNDSDPKIIVGVRSAIFLPIQNLGMIIIDEEHDGSFKQDDRCPYNARDVATKIAQDQNIPVVLGSATPSVETFYNYKMAQKDKTFYHTLTSRYNQTSLPDIQLVSSRQKKEKDDIKKDQENIWPFTGDVVEKIKLALEKKEQVLVFVNRLGFANYIQCPSCGHNFECPNCSISLKYYYRKNTMACHYCDYAIPRPEICPHCQNMNLYQKGFGTERLESILKSIFKTSTIQRFDRDEITTFNQLTNTLKDFHEQQIDILVGTQMLSKGHNFKNVNLVVILGIDAQLNFPDFRSVERTYQLLTQVAGRSGRFGNKSEVLILTNNPQSRVFEHIKKQTFSEIYYEELEIRKICQCPPFYKLIMLYFTSKYQDKVEHESFNAQKIITHLIKASFPSVEILGPRAAIVEKKSNKYTWSLMIRGKEFKEMHTMLKTFQKMFNPHYSVSLKIDVDPYSLD